MPRVTVVLVNYNGGRYLQDCLASLAEQTAPHAVLVVDNASSDRSARAAHAAFPTARFLPLSRNVGFCRAINIAAQRLVSSSDVIVTLNPDTVAEPDFVEHIIAPLVEDSHVAAIAGTLVFRSRPDIVASAGINVHRNGVAIDRLLGESLQRNSPVAPIFGASGGAAAYRLEPFLSAGGFCEPFFLYLEDVDLAWRLRLAGYEALHAPAAVATHAYSASSGEGSPFKRRLLARNRLWALARCLPDSLWRRYRWRILRFDLAAAAYGVARADVHAVRGRAEGLAGLPARLCERRAIQRGARVSAEEMELWLAPDVSGRELLRLRRLTASLASREHA